MIRYSQIREEYWITMYFACMLVRRRHPKKYQPILDELGPNIAGGDFDAMNIGTAEFEAIYEALEAVPEDNYFHWRANSLVRRMSADEKGNRVTGDFMDE